MYVCIIYSSSFNLINDHALTSKILVFMSRIFRVIWRVLLSRPSLFIHFLEFIRILSVSLTF